MHRGWSMSRGCVLAGLLALAPMAMLRAPRPARAAEPAGRMANPVRLGADGYFRLPDGRLYVPLGGLHGNFVPTEHMNLSDADAARLAANEGEFGRRRAASQPTTAATAPRPRRGGSVDIVDAPEHGLRNYMAYLESCGVNSIRLFPRVLGRGDMLDIVGRVNPDIRAGFSRAFAAGKPHGVRFQLMTLGEPGRTPYYRDMMLHRYAIGRLDESQVDSLTPAQRRFLVDRETVEIRPYFTDPDVRACQQLFLGELAKWVADEEQVFCLELYNEQGWWDMRRFDGQRRQVFTFDWEDHEIDWSAVMVRTLKQALPQMPVCLSHPGFGVTGFDPLKWSQGAKVDFYSQHLYANLCGEWDEADFVAVTAATAAIIRGDRPNFCGEWGILNREIDEDILRRNHRDAIWMSLATGAPGFLQWESWFLEENRWANQVFHALPAGFSPVRPAVAVDISREYRTFQDNSRYDGHDAAEPLNAFVFVKRKQSDENYRAICRAFVRSLELGVPIRFVTDGREKAVSMEQFAATDAAAFDRPIRADGWQLAYLKDAHSATWVGYLRSKKVEQVKENFFLAVPVEAPLTLRLDLPPGEYTLTLIDLEADSVSRLPTGGQGEIRVAEKTGAEYAFVITAAGKEPRFEAPARP